jgi:hypothetical protein
MLKILDFKLRAATPEPRSRYTRIPADIMQCAMPIILNMLPQHSHKPVLNALSRLSRPTTCNITPTTP